MADILLKIRLKELANNQINDDLANRHHIHAHPELSFCEKETSAYIASKLDEYGISYRKNIGGYGILGIIKGEVGLGKTIALRADMDALPVNEENNLPYKSEINGVMHACGHDIHTTCLLGVARVLNQLKKEIKGTILLVFQPGEEKIPGGAKLMMEDGLFSEYVPDMIIGQHVYPELPAGQVGFRPGKYMASSDEIYLTFKGKGGHAALPHLTVDTVLMASQAVVSLQQIVSRIIPTQIPAVLSFGNIVCNSVMNVIPETVRLEGTFRTMDEEWRYKTHEHICRISRSVAEGMGGNCEVDILVGFPCVYNNEEVTQKAINAAQDFLGKEQVHALDIRMTAEDFGWYAQKYPACFYRLGTGHTDGTVSGGLHSPKFIANEAAIKIGVETMSWLAISLLD